MNSFSKDFYSALNIELEKKRKQQKDIQNSVTTKNAASLGTSDEYSDRFYSALEKELERKNNRGKSTTKSTIKSSNADDLAPVKNASKDNGKWYDGYIQLGDALSDGYQFGDATKTLVGTNADFATNLISGVVGWGEDAIDAGATVFGTLLEKIGKTEQSEKLKEFVAKDLYDANAVSKKLIKSNALAFLSPEISKAMRASVILDDWLSTKKVDDGFGGTTTVKEDNSTLGDNSDAIIQSAGETLVKMGLQGATGGAPIGDIITAVTVYGGQAEQALREGATFGEATGSGLINAAAEVMFEKLSGGIKIGGKTLDEGLTRIIAKNISNVALKNAVHFGLDVAGEAGEELLTEFVSKLGTKLYKEEDLSEILFSEESLNDYIRAAFSGGLMGGAFNIRNAASGVMDGYDYKTGLTANEQTVIEKETSNRIAEEEKNGKKLTNKDKNTIYDRVLAEMQDGSIGTDTIESILGGDSDKVMNLLQSDRGGKGSMLLESYNERSRHGQAFEADLSQYDEKQRAIVQNAVDSGILNNTNRTHKFVDMIAKIAADKGVSFDFTNNAKLKESGFALGNAIVNGYVTSDGKVGININSAKALNTVVGHEITHVLEGTDLYTDLQTALFEYAKTKGEYQSRYDSLSKLYEGMENTTVEAELTADLVGDYLFTDADFINSLSTNHRNVFEKIYDEIKYLCKVATAGSKEAKELEKVKKLFAEAYRTETKNTTQEDGVRYSFGVTQEDIDAYIDAAYDNNNSEDYVKYAEASDQLIDEVYDEIDITGYAHALRDNDIRHIRNSHGEGTNEKYPVTKEDLAKIPNIVTNYDKVFVKTNAQGKPGLVYVKVGENNVTYYVEAITEEYHKEKLLVNKQMIKTGGNEIPNLYGLVVAINKKESSAQYLADLQKIREAYVQDVKENYSNSKITQSDADVKLSLRDTERKAKQLDIILENNPAYNTYSTWIRDISDIKTFEETLQDNDWADWEESDFDPDYTSDMVKEALDSGKITVYSSYPIEQGVFVTPSKMEAQSYSANGKVYSKTVDVKDVAWIDPTQGQYAKVDQQTKNTTQESGVRYDISEKNDNQISFDSLVAKPDMAVSRIETSLEEVLSKSRTQIVDDSRENLSKYKDNNGIIKVHNADTGMDIVIGKPGLEHGLDRNYEYTAMVSLNIDSYLKNAIKINEAAPDEHRKYSSDILLGYGETESGEKIPAYFVVSKLTTGRTELVEFGSLYSVNAKKLAEDSTKGSSGFQSRTSATISISELLDVVNTMYSDVLPKSVAEHYGIIRRKTKLGDSVKFSLSEDIAPVAPTGTYNVYGKDIALNDDFAPLPEGYEAKQSSESRNTPAPVVDWDEITDEVNRQAEVTARDELAPVRKDLQTQQASASVLTEEPPTAKKQPNAWAMFKRNFVDRGTVFETMSLKTGNHELQGKYKAIGRAENSAQWLMEHGNADTKSLKSIREAVENSGKTQEFSEYLYHLLNVDRMTLENRYDAQNKPVFGDTVTADISRQTANELAQANPEFKQWAEDVYTYVSYLRKMMVDNGIISQETADLWLEMYPHYIPIRRAGDMSLNANVPLNKGKTVVNAPIKRVTGGSSDILPLFGALATRTEQTFKAVAKNRFGVELKNMLGTTATQDAVSLDETIDSVETHEELLQEGKGGKNPTFTVFENGERVTFDITEEMYDDLKPKSKEMSYTNKVMNGINNVRRGLLSEYNPAFMITNPIKDIQDVLINSKHPAQTYANFPKAIAELWSKDGQYYREYMEHGGEHITYFENDTKTFAEEKTALRKVVGFPFDKIGGANEFIERVPRMAEYIASRKAGRSIDVSMLDASRVTTDFSAGGDVTKMLNRNGFTFLNASVQGTVQQVRNIREAKAEGLKGWAKLAAKVIVAGLPSVLLNYLLWDDDEDYEDLSDYVKQNYWIVGKYGDGKFVKIPKGRTVAVIQNAFEQMGNVITGDDEFDLKTFGDLVVSNLAPNNPLDNNIIAPVLQVIDNETWYGEDLVPARLQDLPAEEQFDETTDSISKWLGEKLNISPYKINYVLDQYSGGVGDMVLPMLTPEAEQGSWWGNLAAPILSKFTADSVMKNQNTSDFYTALDELNTNANASGATDEDVLMNKYMNSINSELSDLYKKKREIQNSDLTDAEKYYLVREVQKQINAIAEDSLNTYEDVNIDGEYANIGDKYFKQNNDGEWSKMTDAQVSKWKATTEAGNSNYATDGENHWRYYENGEDSEWRKLSDEQVAKQDVYTQALDVSAEDYWRYMSELNNIKSDKDKNGKTIKDSRKDKVIEWLEDLDADYYEKLILFRSEYKADDTYNDEIISYLKSRKDISDEEMRTILTELKIEWD